MSDNVDRETSGGSVVCGLLGVAFVVLKLCGVIDWSWWWVTAPFWGGLAIALVILAIADIIAAGCRAVVAVDNIKSKKTKKIKSTDYEIVDKN